MKLSNSASDRVRATRDGDRFHYMWTANRLLKLLDPTSGLKQISIEGLGFSDEPELEGEEVVDIAEYYEDNDEKINEIRIYQFKHSTFHVNKNLVLSEINKIIQKFEKLDADFSERHPDVKTTFWVITNKPICQDIIEAVDYIASKKQISDNLPASKILSGTKIGLDRLISICSRIKLLGNEPSIISLRQKTNQEIANLSADIDSRAFTALLEIVAAHAGTESNGPILKQHVLEAFHCREDDLAPAPCQLEDVPFIQRQEYSKLAKRILDQSEPIVITAEGGVGKSTFARALPTLLRDFAEVIIYDCFGKGSYRRPDCPRHRHQDGLIQIATEIAALNLGLPIIPTSGVDSEEYMKLFVQRLKIASEILKERGSRHLVILVDAADNAVIAAEERAGRKAFVCDLINLSDAIPNNVRIVFTCRPERLNTLNAPRNIAKFELSPYSQEETAHFVRKTYKIASDKDIAEIHAKTGGNPRVVSAMLDETSTIQEVLDRLAGIVDTDAPLDALMQKRFDNAIDNAGKELRQKLECVANLIAILRPGIPLDILVKLAEIELSAINSFISDMGRGLVVNSDHLQFLDEPTETYFRRKNYTEVYVSDEIVARLKKLSISSSYAAASLPEVLWNMEKYDDLLELSNSDEALPTTNDIEHTQVQRLRVEFGLRAAVKLRCPEAIVPLAMRAGKEREVESKQFKVIRDNPDIAGSSMDTRLLSELIATRKLPSSWPGSTLGAEALMLAYNKKNIDIARSRVRQAKFAIIGRSRTTEDKDPCNGSITSLQIAHVALAILQTDGPKAALEFLYQWQPEWILVEVGSHLASVLISREDEEHLVTLINHLSHPMLLIGFLAEMQRSAISIETNSISSIWEILDQIDHCLVDSVPNWDVLSIAYRGVSWISAIAVRHSIIDVDKVVKKLQVFLPLPLPVGLGYRATADRPGILFAIALMIELQNETLDINHYCAIEMEGDQNRTGFDREEGERLLRNLKPCLSWLAAWAKFSLGKLEDKVILELIQKYPKSPTADDINSPQLRLARSIMPLIVIGSKMDSVKSNFIQKVDEITASHPVEAAQDILPVISRKLFPSSVALEIAASALQFLTKVDTYDNQKTDFLVKIARGIYRFSKPEGEAYFNLALKSTMDAGDGAHFRWEVVMSLAQISADTDRNCTHLAKRLARLGEIVANIYGNVDERNLAATLALLAGPDVLQILGEWRDRRFGRLDIQCQSIVEKGNVLFADCPALKFIFAPFSSAINLNRVFIECKNARCAEACAISTSALKDFAFRLGRSFDAEYVLSSGSDIHRAEKIVSIPTRNHAHSHEYETQYNAKVEEVCANIDPLDLTRVEELDRALLLLKKARVRDDVIVSQVFSRDEVEWSSIFYAVSSSISIDYGQFVKILNEAFLRREFSKSLSFIESLKKLVEVHIERYSSRLLLGNPGRLNLIKVADVMKISVEELLQVSLGYLDIDEVLTDAWRCYELAISASKMLKPSAALQILEDAVTLFEEDLGLQPLEIEQGPVKASSELALANFLWSALADPRAAVRWQAAHAVRIAIELEMEDVVRALCDVVMGLNTLKYFDDRFPFYEMSAAEWFLIAVERSVLGNPGASKLLLPVVDFLSKKYPDHATIQFHCYNFTLNSSFEDLSIGTNWSNELLPLDFVENFHRGKEVRPYIKGAARSDFRFGLDFEEHVLGKLTRAFNIEHKEVLDSASDLILREWKFEHGEDPRHLANIFQQGETFGYKYEVPRAEDFRYYLQRHAALTIAGRLMRNEVPYCDPGEKVADVLKWIADFDIKRSDRRWITDQRGLVPDSVRKAIDFSSCRYLDFFAPVVDADCVVVWQSAYLAEYASSRNIDIRSVLVTKHTANALVRALQTGEGYWSFRLPSFDPEDEDFQFDFGDFQLRGWISDPYSEGGIDELDQFAQGLKTFLPTPSQEIVDLLDIVSFAGGTLWRKNNGDDLIMAAETWTDATPGHDIAGFSGYRLRIDKKALDEMLRYLDLALVMEVKFMEYRNGDRYFDRSQSEEPDDGCKDDFRIFSYVPEAGWRDCFGDIRLG
ncbi:ATP-binding protein [Corynebacterium durum]|nr:ATP-binding protein [Corynebacterium durum]